MVWFGIGVLCVATAGLLFAVHGIREFTHDNFLYMLKGLEIRQGNWTPMRNAAIGWSVMLSSLYALLNIDGFRAAETVASLVGVGFATLTIPLAYLLLSRTLSATRMIAALVFWALVLVAYCPTNGLSEPFYIVLLFSGVTCLVRALRPRGSPRRRLLVSGGALLGLAMVVRTAGIVLWPAGICCLALEGRERRERAVAIALFTAAFWVAVSPSLIQRAVLFNGPFDYGPANRLTVESSLEAQSENLAPVSVREYFRTHSYGFLAHKYLSRGLLGQAGAFFALQSWPLGALLTAGLAGLLPVVRRNQRNPDPLIGFAYLVVVTNFALLTLTWPVFQTFRYWVPYLLFVAVPALTLWEGWETGLGRQQRGLRVTIPFVTAALFVAVHGLAMRNRLSAAFHSLPEMSSHLARIADASQEEDPSYAHPDGLELARYLDRCCHHSRILNVGAGQGSYAFDILRHFRDLTILPDSRRPYSPSRDIRVSFPGLFSSLEEFVRYVIGRFDYMLLAPMSYSYGVEYPYLKELRSSPYAGLFQRVYVSQWGTEVYRLASRLDAPFAPASGAQPH